MSEVIQEGIPRGFPEMVPGRPVYSVQGFVALHYLSFTNAWPVPRYSSREKTFVGVSIKYKALFYRKLGIFLYEKVASSY